MNRTLFFDTQFKNLSHGKLDEKQYCQLNQKDIFILNRFEMNIKVFWNIHFSNLYFMFSEVPTARAKQKISGYLKEKMLILVTHFCKYSSATLFYYYYYY